MTLQSSLEIKGNLVTHTCAELASEIAQAKLTGSLRLENLDRKAVLYFKAGGLAFAVSNSRSSRLFELLVERERISNSDLASIENFANDFELAARLQASGIVDRDELDLLTREQINRVVVDVFSWSDGSWMFTSLARLRDGLDYGIDLLPLLSQYGRCLTQEMILKRVNLKEDVFSIADLELRETAGASDYGPLLQKFSYTPVRLEEFFEQNPDVEREAIRSIYALWLTGLLERDNWHPAFTDSAIRVLKGTRLELVKEASRVSIAPPPKPEPEPIPITDAADTLDVEVYLSRVETAETFYDVLGVDPASEQATVKEAYLSLAKMFHPDRFYKQTNGLGPRVQSAFTELSKAYETLKTADSRELYDFRMRKELAEKKARGESGRDQNTDERLNQASASFQHGQALLQEGDWQRATAFLARAAHLDAKNARYRAEYGQALSKDPAQRHKAEAELQAAVKIAPDQPSYRLMLARFYIDINLRKRAEGELGRILKTFPQNREAAALLDSLK